MPIIKDEDVRLYEPEPQSPIFRYMDFTKFISMLNNQSLFFCRQDKLEDHLEGTTSISTYKSILKREKHRNETFYNPKKTNSEVIKLVEEFFENEKYFKTKVCINSWSIGDIESAALWKIYSAFNQGIMVKSNVSSLTESFKNTIE